MRQKTKRDWSAYNKSLVKRGDLFLWYDEETLSNWYSAPDCNKQGRPYTYSDVAIQTLLSIREVFQPSRIDEKMESLPMIIDLDWNVERFGSFTYRRIVRRRRPCNS